MREVEPIVIKLAETRVVPLGIDAMLQALGASDETRSARVEKGQDNAEEVIEMAGRMCYKSFEIGMNPNVTKIRQDSKDYFENILKKGDGSILEHGSVTFALLNVSRVFTHELVRHRVGTAFSQESLRYVRPKDIGIWIPDELTHEQHLKLESAVMEIEAMYQELEKLVDWDKLPFDKKKRLTSAFRRMLPDGMATNIVFTANHRTLRWLIEMRTDPAAEVEIRLVFDEIATILKTDFPLIYMDFTRTELPDGTGQWKPSLRSKV